MKIELVIYVVFCWLVGLIFRNNSFTATDVSCVA